MTTQQKQLENIQVETDDTDHFCFICPDCGTILRVTNCSTSIEVACFYLKCEVCRGVGHRKINYKTFHTVEDL